jgi:hypothetical protein
MPFPDNRVEWQHIRIWWNSQRQKTINNTCITGTGRCAMAYSL